MTSQSFPTIIRWKYIRILLCMFDQIFSSCLTLDTLLILPRDPMRFMEVGGQSHIILGSLVDMML